MKILDFVMQYPDEVSCRTKFKEYRDKEGVICPHCGSKEPHHYRFVTGL
jgi:rRNA maturation endonuclease Nob1